MKATSIQRGAVWVLVCAVLAFLYVPLTPPLLFSMSADGTGDVIGQFTLRWYVEMWRNPILTGSIETSLLVALAAGIATPLLALLAAMAVRELRAPRLLTLVFLLPLFIPAVSMGLAMAIFFRLTGVPPSLWAICLVHIMWALPFAFLIILTVMATFDPIYLEAAYVHGAGRWRAFRDIELPLIWPGVSGAGVFAMILSFNETVRTALVQGPYNTVQTYIWATYLQIGLSPTLYALMSLLILVTLALMAVTSVLRGRRVNRRAARSS
jgi:ABC-type spermidine/putrescine transport system permease subunit II